MKCFIPKEVAAYWTNHTILVLPHTATFNKGNLTDCPLFLCYTVWSLYSLVCGPYVFYIFYIYFFFVFVLLLKSFIINFSSCLTKLSRKKKFRKAMFMCPFFFGVFLLFFVSKFGLWNDDGGFCVSIYSLLLRNSIVVMWLYKKFKSKRGVHKLYAYM